MISQAKAGFLFMAAGTIVVGLVKAIANPRRGVAALLLYVLLGAAAIAVLYGGYVYLAPLLPGGAIDSYYALHWLRNPSAIMDYLVQPDKGGQAGRLGGTLLVLTQARSQADLLIGHGPGLLSGSALTGQSSGDSSAINFALAWATSLTRFLFEVGIVGILLYLTAMAAALGALVKAWTSRGEAIGISVAAAAIGAAAVFVAGAIYHAPWTTDAIAVPFWCLLGMAVKWGRLRAAEQDASAADGGPTAAP